MADQATTDESEGDASRPPDDPLALVGRLIEIAAGALSLYYLWSVVRGDPQIEELRRRVVARWESYKRRRRFANVNTVAAEAELISRGEQ